MPVTPSASSRARGETASPHRPSHTVSVWKPPPSRSQMSCETSRAVMTDDRRTGSLALAAQGVYAVGVVERPLQLVTQRPALSSW